MCDVTRYCPQRVLLAIGICSNDQIGLYVSYRGTYSYEDMLTDLDLDMVMDPSMGRSKCHKGYLERSKNLSPQTIFNCAKYYQAQNVVFCGHSLGGAVASLSAISFMEFPKDFDDIAPFGRYLRIRSKFTCLKIAYGSLPDVA